LRGEGGPSGVIGRREFRVPSSKFRGEELVEAFVDGGGGHVDGGEDEDRVFRARGRDGVDDFAAAGADAGGAVAEEGEVAAVAAGEGGEAVGGPVQLEELVEGEEGEGAVGAAAAEAGAGGDALMQRDVYTGGGREVGGVEEAGGGLDDEVAGVGGEGGVVGGEADAGRIGEGEFQVVKEPDGDHPRTEGMETVRGRRSDTQVQIDFRGRGDAHGRRVRRGHAGDSTGVDLERPPAHFAELF